MLSDQINGFATSQNKLILPLISELIISVRHPCTLLRTYQHCCIFLFPRSVAKSPSKEVLLAASSETYPFPLGD